MQRIYYASGSLVTGDAIADAVLQYAEALAKTPLADIITIPVYNPTTAARVSASLLIGPASQLMCVEEPIEGLDEIVDVDLVAELHRRTVSVGRPRRAASGAGETVDLPEEFS